MPIESAHELLHRKREVATRTRRRLSDDLFAFGDNERLELVFDLEMHLAFLGEALRLGVPQLFSEYATWTTQLLQTAGGDIDQLESCLDAIEAELRSTGTGGWLDEMQMVLTEARSRMRTDLPIVESHLRADNPHCALATAFLDACLHLRRATAVAMVKDAAERGIPVDDIYLHVITPAMRELGRMWHLNQVTIGQEHYCTAVAQMVMAQLFPAIFDGDRRPLGRVVSVCVAGELHEIGARMVADLFEMNGWDTVFLGSDVPKSSIIDTLVETDAEVLAISATLAANLGHVSDLIDAVRQEPACAAVKVLVGGAAFAIEPSVWQRVGADGWAPDATDALTLAHGWRRE